MKMLQSYLLLCLAGSIPISASAQGGQFLLLKAASPADWSTTTAVASLGEQVQPAPGPTDGLTTVQTKDGCQFLVSAAAARDLSKSDEEDFEDRVWDGVCLDGWAYGPGTTSGRYSTVEYEWVQAGLPIGRFKRAEKPDSGGMYTEEGYRHPSLSPVYFSQVGYTRRQGEKDSITQLVKGVTDGSRLVFGQNSDFGVTCAQKNRRCIVEASYLPHHSYERSADGIMKFSPCQKAICKDEWIQYVRPLLDEMNMFIAQNKPQVDQIIQANTASLSRGTTLKQRTEAAMLARTAAQQKARERVALLERQEAERKAERQRAFSEAKTARRPVATPNLDALIARAQAIKIPAPLQQQPAISPSRPRAFKK